MKGNWKFWTQKDPFNRRAPFVLFEEHANGDRDFILLTTQKRVPDTELAPDGELPHFTPGVFQAMMEGLWEAGYRPAGYQEPREHIATMDRHLQDMRAIASKLIKVQLP